MTPKTQFRLLLVAVMAGCTAYIFYAVFREGDPLGPCAQAEAAYDSGRQHEANKEPTAAAADYDRSLTLLEVSYKRASGRHNLKEDDIKDLAARIFYLKYKAIRDKQYALAAAAGKPLPSTSDSVTGEEFRNIAVVPDAKARDEAAGNLRGAALLVAPKNYDAQLDALRLTLVNNPVNWDHVEKISKAILAIKPDDSRAKYLLARIDYEQIDPATGAPTPPAKRSRDRLKAALRLSEGVRTDPKFPLWRNEYLLAGIHQALMKSAKDGRGKIEELETLDRILLDPKQGAIARIARGEHVDRLSSWDSDAILGLYSLAIEIALETSREKLVDVKSPEPRPESLSVPDVFLALQKFCADKVARNDPAFPRSMLAAKLMDAMIAGQSILALGQTKEWRDGLAFVSGQFKTEFDADRCDVFRVAQFAELLMREAQIAIRRKAPNEAIDLRAEAKKWLDEGFVYAKRHQLTDVQAMPLNLLAANLAFVSGEKREAVMPYLRALQRTGLEQAAATSLMIEGVYDEREGRLLQAREKIEKALKLAKGDEEIRGHAALANIYMAIGRADYALTDLLALQGIYNRFEDLSTLEKEWLSIYLRGVENYRALLAVASLETARRQIGAYYAKNPTAKTYPPELVKENEDRVKKLLERDLASPTSQPGFVARSAWVQHLSATGRPKEAMEQWQILNLAVPDRVELLTLRIGMLDREARESGDARKKLAFAADADKLVRDFVEKHPTNQSAHLYYAAWLAHTKRTEQAQKYLKQIVDTSPITPETRRLATAIELTLNSDISPIALARHLPRDPQVDKVLFDLGANSVDAKAEIRGALIRADAVGLTRVMEADDLFTNGDYAKAVDAFAATLDFTRVKAFAEQGLLRSMAQLANQDPQAATIAAQRLITDFPNEPVTWLCSAFVCLAKDDIGQPGDDWDRRRCMASALNVWERKLPAAGPEQQVGIALTRAEFWLRAHRYDVALQQAKRALAIDRNNPTVLAACATIVLDDPSRVEHPELRGFLEDLNRVAPKSLVVQRLQARSAENARHLEEAAAVYEQIVTREPADRESYYRLVGVLESQGKFPEALKWIKSWRETLPSDAQAAAAEIRVLLRSKEPRRAADVADQYLKQVQADAAKKAAELRDPAAKTRFLADSRWLPQIEIARGFLFGGDLAEARRRLEQIPPESTTPASQLLLAEIYIKDRNWPKAESTLADLIRKQPRNLAAVNNLAYLLAVPLKNPAKAREVILASLKSDTDALTLRATDRVPVELLHTAGVVYVALNDPALGRELLSLFSTAAQRYPGDPRIDLYTGFGYELLGDPLRARDHYDRALAKAAYPALSNEDRNSLLTDAGAFRNRVIAKLKGQ